MGNLQEPNVLSKGENSRVLSNPSSSQIGNQSWDVAEKAAQKIILKLHPTADSDARRFKVINYIRKLVKNSNLSGVEVFAYGSVPLKTYLPDGDIDLTAFAGAIDDEALANGIVHALQREEKDNSAEYAVKEIRLINAEVKLVKCLVQNIVVDISFDQLGGLCTLCFLEQVDHYIGRNHLFKRSILLIKAWCYYESRILGAHHGLISTYALETLVLYIFQVFHSTLDGPLAVLYKFLDYFGKFDWENYCITLRGPVRLSSLQEFETEIPENIGSPMLLTEDFYKYCVDEFSVPLKDADMGIFSKKHLNIVDPLKKSNNLGRSISEGNFYRIKSALTFGARKLEKILVQIGDSVAVELNLFFANTLDRHGGGQRPDLQNTVHILAPAHIHSKISELESDGEGKERVGISTAEGNTLKHINIPHLPHVHMLSHGSANTRDVQEYEDHAVARIQGLQINSNTFKERSNIQGHGVMYAPHQYFFTSSSGCGESTYENNNQSENNTSGASRHLQEPVEDRGTYIASASSLDTNCNLASADNAASSESSDLLLDLRGNFNTHYNCLLHGRWFYKSRSNTQAWSVPPPPRPLHFQIPNGGFNGMVHGPPVLYPVNSMFVQGASYGLNDMPKPRGTGTYLPNMNRPLPSYRAPSVRGRIVDCSVAQPSGVVNIGPLPHVPPGSHFHSSSRLSRPPSSFPQSADHVLPFPSTESPEAVVGQDDARSYIAPSPYHLKDEDDFPPLST